MRIVMCSRKDVDAVDRLRPTFTCDTCGKAIEDLRLGLVSWASAPLGEDVADLRITHKGTCDTKLESSIELLDFLQRLSVSLCDWEAEQVVPDADATETDDGIATN